MDQEVVFELVWRQLLIQMSEVINHRSFDGFANVACR